MNRSLQRLILAGFTGIVLVATPLVGYAQTPRAPQPGPHQAQGLPPAFMDLNLSDDQTSEIESILSDGRQQVMGLFTSDQLQARQQTMMSGGTPEEAFAAMDLTDEQVSQLQTIRRNSMTQIMTVLDDDQKAMLQQNIQQSMQQNGQRRPQ